MNDEMLSPAQRISRRELMRRTLLGGAAIGLSPSLLSALEGTAAAATSAVASGTINFFSWQGYDLLDEAVMKAWRKKNGVTIHSTYVNTHNDITAKFTAGGGKGIYNLSTYEAGYGPFYVGLKIPQPLDMSKIPNFKNAAPLFKSGAVAKLWWNFAGHQWAVPFTWGIQGINYASDKTKAPAHYRDLLKPEFKKKFGVTDDPVAAIVIGAHVTGVFRPDSRYTKAQLDKIIAFWKTLKANARLIVPSYGNMADLFASGEIVAATPGWAAVNSFAAAKGDKAVKHTAPAEGSASFCDAFFIPQGAKDTDAVYAYINQAFSLEAQAQEAETLVQAAVAPGAVKLMNAETRALYPYKDMVKVLTRTAPLETIPTNVPKGYATFDDWNKAWEKFKA
jgi:spermidine/putrescine transport system substrate-binding protein